MKIDPNAPAQQLSIRGYLAGLAMQAMVSKIPHQNRPATSAVLKKHAEIRKVAAASAVKYADALIEALNNTEHSNGK